MKTAFNRPFLVAVMCATAALLLSGNALAQTVQEGTWRIQVWQQNDGGAYDQFAPFCEAGAPCSDVEDIEVCIDANAQCQTTGADGQVDFTGLPYGNHEACVSDPRFSLVSGSAVAGQSDANCVQINLDEPDLTSAMYVELQQATITVTKEFSDDNPQATTTISLDCDTGTVDTSDSTTIGDGGQVEFTVTGFTAGDGCTVEETDVTGYSTTFSSGDCDSSGDVDDMQPGGDYSCTVTNEQDSVTVTVNKSYTLAHPVADPEVQVSLSCGSGTITTSPATTTSKQVTFEVSDFPWDGTTCEAAETVPLGYVQQSSNCTGLAVAPTDGAGPSCTITNRPTEATFTVNKNFSDSNPVLAVSVTPLCTDAAGGPAITYSPSSGNALHGTNFVTTVRYFNGATNCTASEVDPVGYTQDLAVSTCDTNTAISDVSDGSCIIHNQQDPVDIVASKEYTEGNGGPAGFEVSCGAGSVQPGSDSASPGSPAVFTVSNFPWNGTQCTVTEPVPPSGYYVLDTTCEGLGIVPSDSDTLCTITNAPTRATFDVTKDFTDGNPNEVEVTIECNTGLPIEQSQEIDEWSNVKFVVVQFDAAELDCEVSEVVPNGYSPTYTADTEEDGEAGSVESNEDECEFDDVVSGGFTCHIVNTPDPVDIDITKEWVFEGSSDPQGVSTYYELTLYCDAEIVDGSESCSKGEIPVGPSQTWCKTFYGNGSDEFNAEVIPEYPTSHCHVVEDVEDSAVEVDNGCGYLVVSAGEGDSCTIVNTLFFEGIPTLNQYGLALMALLMLGIGLVGFRRFN